MKLSPMKIAGLLTAATGAITQIAPLLPPQYHTPVIAALPFLSLLAGLFAPHPLKKVLPATTQKPMFPTIPPKGAGQ